MQVTRVVALSTVLVALASHGVLAQVSPPRYVISHGEKVRAIVDGVFPGHKERGRILRSFGRLNRHVLSDPIEEGTSLEDRLVILPDARNPNRMFNWFTCNRMEELIQYAARKKEGQLVRVLRGLSNQHFKGTEHNNIVHVLVADDMPDASVFVAGNISGVLPVEGPYDVTDTGKVALKTILNSEWFNILRNKPLR